MPYPFILSTTSNLAFFSSVISVTHPSLPSTTTIYRDVVRNVLKKHKRLPPLSRAADLTTVSTTVNDYLPFLLALDAGLSGQSVSGEYLDLSLGKEIEVEWRTTLASTLPGREPSRVNGRGLDYEICFALNTLGFVHTLQARAQLLALYGNITPTPEQRASIITSAAKQLLQSNSIHSYLACRMTETDISSAVVETISQTQEALGLLSLAEATLLAVLKDDPYPAVVAQGRNKNDKEWMIKPPEVPKVRAHLFARLCLAAAEHASQAEAMLSASGRIEESLMQYTADLRKASRAKACRFFGIDAELGGETGTGIAWLIGGKKQLQFASPKDGGSKIKGLAKFKKDWKERREDKRIEEDGEWGTDAGRLEELRIIEMLEQKWNKMNDMVCKVSQKSCIRGLRSDVRLDQYAIYTLIRTPRSKHALW